MSNPLATTVRFAFATRGEGQFKLEPLQNLNLRLGYNLKIGGQKIETAMDIFNILNKGTYEQFLDGANQQYSPNYGLGRARQIPRVFQASLRYAF